MNTPATLDAGVSTDHIDLFSVTLNMPYVGSWGPQMGTYDVLGVVEGPAGYDGATQNLLGESVFTVNVVPEPRSTWPLLIAGCGTWIGWRRRCICGR
jgi:hypothetical protein